MFVLAVTFEIAADHLEDFRAAILKQAANSREREPWCLQFDICFDPESPTTCFLYEKYDSREAIPKHRATEHFAEYNATVEDWIVDKSVAMYEVVEK